MIALGLVGLLAAAAAQPRAFLSVDRTFLPGQPGTIVHVELEGGQAIDVRLYQLRDPERFLLGGDPDRPLAERARPLESRSPSPGDLLSAGAAAVRGELKAGLDRVLTPRAREALHVLAPGVLVRAPRELPFLRGERLLRRWTLPCGGAEAQSYCDVDLGPLSSGAYLVEGVVGAQAGYAVVLVSGLALAAHRLPGQLLLFAADARTGQPKPGVQIGVTGDDGQPLAHGATSVQGTFAAKLAPRRVSVLARSGADLAVLDLDYFTARLRAPRTWISTDRGEVRPGDTVRFMGVEAPAPPAPRDLAVTLEDARGTPVARGTAYQNMEGLFSGELAVPPGAAQGLGHVIASLDGREASGEVWLRNPPPAELMARAELAPPGEHGGPLSAVVRATNAVGEPVEAEVGWRLFRTALAPQALPAGDEAPLTEELSEGEARTGPDGVARFDISLPDGPDARFELEADARDAGGRQATARASIALLQGPVHLSVTTDRRIYTPGETARVRLVATDAQGQPAPARVTLRASASRALPGGEASSAPAGTFQVAVPSTGAAEVDLPQLAAGYYEIEAFSGAQRLGEAVVFVTRKGGDIPFTPDELTLVPDKPAYAPGDTARVLLFAPFESANALVAVESSDLLKQEVVAIHGSSALFTFKVAPGMAPGVAVSASAVFGGQAYRRTRIVRVSPGPPALALDVSLLPGARAGQVELRLRARDAQGKPVAGAQALASYRDAAYAPPLAPPLLDFMNPKQAPEGRTDFSLDYESAGYSGGGGTRAERDAERDPQRNHGDAAQPEGPGPSPVQPPAPARALHSTLAGLEHLPPTDRQGQARLIIDASDAREIAVNVVAASPQGAGLAEVSAPLAVPWVTAVPALPSVVRPGDRVQAEIALEQAHGTPAVAQIGDQDVPVPPGGEAVAALSLEAKRTAYRVAAEGHVLLEGRIPSASGEEWLSLLAGEAPASTGVRLAGEDDQSTFRLRVVSGPMGLLRLLAGEPRASGRTRGFEQAHLAGAPAFDSADELCARVAVALANAAPGKSGQSLQDAIAPLAGLAAADGSVSAYRGGPPDRSWTALSLWLLSQSQSAGGAPPQPWIDLIRGWLEQDMAKAGGVRALSALALAASGGAPADALAALEAQADDSALSDADRAYLALALAKTDVPAARAIASALEGRPGLAGARACWSAERCDPQAPTNPSTLATTAAVALALAQLSPASPRVAQGLRYLLDTRDQAAWGMGMSGALIPLALVAGRRALPDRPTRVALFSAGREIARADVPPGGDAVLYAAGGPVLLKVAGGPAFFDLARSRAEPGAASGELKVERRFFRAVGREGKAEREPLSARVEKGAVVWVELTIQGAPPGAPVTVEDRFPAALTPIEQVGTEGPVAKLQAPGGQATFMSDRVRLHGIAGKEPLVMGYLARARLAGHVAAPPAIATSGELSGRSAQAELDVAPDRIDERAVGERP